MTWQVPFQATESLLKLLKNKFINFLVKLCSSNLWYCFVLFKVDNFWEHNKIGWIFVQNVKTQIEAETVLFSLWNCKWSEEEFEKEKEIHINILYLWVFYVCLFVCFIDFFHIGNFTFHWIYEHCVCFPGVSAAD